MSFHFHMASAQSAVATPARRSRLRPSPLDRAAFREYITARIDRLILILDTIDGDCDREDDDPSEHSLGWIDGQSHFPNLAADREIDADFEPLLGWTKTGAHGCNDDCEEDGSRIEVEPEVIV